MQSSAASLQNICLRVAESDNQNLKKKTFENVKEGNFHGKFWKVSSKILQKFKKITFKFVRRSIADEKLINLN